MMCSEFHTISLLKVKLINRCLAQSFQMCGRLSAYLENVHQSVPLCFILNKTGKECVRKDFEHTLECNTII